MKNPNKNNSRWVDVVLQEYPRLLFKEDAEQFHGGYTMNNTEWAFECVHQRNLQECCVACEGLSILDSARR